MAGTAPASLPYLPSPALAHTTTHGAVAGRTARHLPAAQLLVFGAGLIALFAAAAALVAPQVTAVFHRVVTPAVSAPATPPLSSAELDAVVSYARQMRADDNLVQVRPGVFAKRSNVEGVQVGGRTIFYDIMPHQSFGPLRAGRVAESDVNILGRESTGDSLVLVYTLK